MFFFSPESSHKNTSEQAREIAFEKVDLKKTQAQIEPIV